MSIISELIIDSEKSGAIEELEKIKEELLKIYQEEIKNDSKWSAGVKYSCKIIDNHISELKGDVENNGNNT